MIPNPEIITTEFQGVQLRLHLTHADADRILSGAGWLIPSIPEGCNTSVFYFTTREGLQALALNQRGFSPEARDNEREVNGCQVIVCLDRTLDLIDARKLLQAFHDKMNQP